MGSGQNCVYWGREGSPGPLSSDFLPVADVSLGVEAGDVNGDGITDVLVLNDGPNELLFFDGHGGFDSVLLEGYQRSVSATIVDLNGDAVKDIFIANGCNPMDAEWRCRDGDAELYGEKASNQILLAVLSNHAFTSSVLPHVAVTNDVLLADFNQDGYKDIFFAESELSGGELSDTVRNIHYGDGEGGFVAVPVYATSAALVAATAADFNSDGFLDIIVVGSMYGRVDGYRVRLDTVCDLLLSNGAGGFEHAPGLGPVLNITSHTRLESGDFNGDGCKVGTMHHDCVLLLAFAPTPCVLKLKLGCCRMCSSREQATSGIQQATGCSMATALVDLHHTEHQGQQTIRAV